MAIEVHLKGHSAHHPNSTADPAADIVLNAPISNGAF